MNEGPSPPPVPPVKAPQLKSPSALGMFPTEAVPQTHMLGLVSLNLAGQGSDGSVQHECKSLKSLSGHRCVLSGKGKTVLSLRSSEAE